MQTGKAVTSGVVLRVTDTKETDRILTVLTADRGKIPLIARGARRKNSRLAAACQMPAYSELTIYKRGGWYLLDEASPVKRKDFAQMEPGLSGKGHVSSMTTICTARTNSLPCPSAP